MGREPRCVCRSPTEEVFFFLNRFTRVWCLRLAVDQLNDFIAILSRDDCDAGNAGDEVLQGNAAL